MFAKHHCADDCKCDEAKAARKKAKDLAKVACTLTVGELKDLTEALAFATRAMECRDEMNACIHCDRTRLSPVTVRLQRALAMVHSKGEVRR